MPNQRSPGQKLVGFPADEKLVELLDAVRGETSRSAVLREALAEYLDARDIEVPPELTKSPDRVGKGGPRKLRASKNPTPERQK